MASQLTLYHHHGSFYSQKARVAFAEKGISYKSRPVALLVLENWEPWFVRMNPQGKLPVLDTGSEIIADSNNIIRYMDKKYPEKLLIPTDDSPTSQRVRHLHERLDSVNIPSLTYGSLNHPDMVEGSKFPRVLRSLMTDKFADDAGINKLKRYAEENPDLREIYEAKLVPFKEMRDSMFHRPKVEASLAHLKSVLDEVEEALATYATEESPWLGGASFTVADICLGLTLERMKFVGFSRQLWERGQRPLVAKYYTNVSRRPTFVAEVSSTRWQMLKFLAPVMLKRLAKPILLTSLLGAAAAVGIWWYKTK